MFRYRQVHPVLVSFDESPVYVGLTERSFDLRPIEDGSGCRSEIRDRLAAQSDILFVIPRMKVCQNASRLQVLMVVAQKLALTKSATFNLSASIAIGDIIGSGTTGLPLKIREPSLLRAWNSPES